MDIQENLTLKAKVVSGPYDGVVPQPGHSLVVFEKVGAGKQGTRLIKVLADMEKFISIPFKNYQSYAVKNSPSLDYEYKSKLFHKDESLSGYDNRIQRHGFVVNIRLKFHVYDFGYLAIHIDDDPLRAVCTEIEHEIGEALRKFQWTKLQREKDFNNAEQLFVDILTEETETAYGKKSRERHFKEHAERLGIKLLRINCGFDFAGNDLQVIEANADTLAKERIDSLNSEIDRQKKAVKRGEETYDRLASGIQTIIGSLAENTDTVDKLKRLLSEAKNMSSELYSFSQAKEATALPKSNMADIGLLANMPSGQFELLKEMRQAMENYDANKLGLVDNSQLLTPLLHWLVELSLGEKADVAVLEKYRAAIRKALIEMTDKREISDAKAEELIHLLESKSELMRRFA